MADVPTPRPTRPLDRTVRVIGVALAAGGRAVDFALIESDGGRHVRRIETERQPLAAGGISAAVVAAIRTFMGDRALQPFAVDLIGLADDARLLTAADIGAGLEVDTRHAGVGRGRASAGRMGRAERAALAVVAEFVQSKRVKDDRAARPMLT